MIDIAVNIDGLKVEDIDKLSEEEVHHLMYTQIAKLPKDHRSRYMDMLRTTFDLRSISPVKRNLRKDMMLYGYKFFPIPNNNDLIIGIKRKIVKQ